MRRVRLPFALTQRTQGRAGLPNPAFICQTLRLSVPCRFLGFINEERLMNPCEP